MHSCCVCLPTGKQPNISVTALAAAACKMVPACSSLTISCCRHTVLVYAMVHRLHTTSVLLTWLRSSSPRSPCSPLHRRVWATTHLGRGVVSWAWLPCGWSTTEMWCPMCQVCAVQWACYGMQHAQTVLHVLITEKRPAGVSQPLRHRQPVLLLQRTAVGTLHGS
jgi:hypothetical protein